MMQNLDLFENIIKCGRPQRIYEDCKNDTVKANIFSFVLVEVKDEASWFARVLLGLDVNVSGVLTQ